MAKRKRWKKVVDPLNVSGYTRDALTGWGALAEPKTKLGRGLQDLGSGIKDTATGETRRKEMDKQIEAQEGALGLQREMWEDTKSMQEPWLEHGEAALDQLSDKTLGGEFDTPVTRWSYDRLPYEQHGYEQIDRQREYDPLQAEREYNQIPIERGYEEVTPERYDAKPWDISQLADDPGYQFRLKQGQEAITSAAGAGGNRLSGGTLKALAEYGQGLASQEAGNAYNRHAQDRAFGYGADQDYQAAVRGERGFKYGTGQDYMANLAGERAFEYGTGRDYRGDLERERGFKYGTGRDYMGDMERERGFKYGAGQDYLANLAGERGFQYGADQDFQNRYTKEMGDRYNRLAGLSGTGQVASQSLGSQGLNAAANMGNIMGNIGIAQGTRAMAGQQGVMDLLSMGRNAADIGGAIGGFFGRKSK